LTGRLAGAAAALAVVASALAAAAALADAASAGKATTADALRLTDEIAATVSRLRELPLKEPIVKGVISRDEARALFADHAAKDRTAEQMAAEGALLVKLGAMAAGTNYRALVLDLLAEQVAGFYDTDRRKLFLADWLGPDPIALAHEITHALQDQNFDLKRWEPRAKASSDFALAFSALVEGDAVASMIDYGLAGKRRFTDVPGIVEAMRKDFESGSRPEATSTSPRFDAAPAVLRRVLVFPYLDGFAFVHDARRRGPWSVVDRMYADPPASTEQILHPERYVLRDSPVELAVPCAPSLERTHRLLFEDVLGEAALAAVLADRVPADVARIGAAGWGGDRLAVYGPRDATLDDPATPAQLAGLVVLGRLQLDTVRDAEEAAAALTIFAAALGGAGVPSGPFAVERRGLKVLWSAGLDPAVRDRVVAELWAGF
jgi:hypothetical protein